MAAHFSGMQLNIRLSEMHLMEQIEESTCRGDRARQEKGGIRGDYDREMKGMSSAQRRQGWMRGYKSQEYRQANQDDV